MHTQIATKTCSKLQPFMYSSAQAAAASLAGIQKTEKCTGSLRTRGLCSLSASHAWFLTAQTASHAAAGH
jgi:hypothetical protein